MFRNETPGNETNRDYARDYARIARVIDYLARNKDQQPQLAQLAELVHLSPSHFQRLFQRWAGVSPKKFLQVLTVEHAKTVLRQSQPLLAAAQTTGLSSSGRLHDHFITLEAMTPGEYRRGGEGLELCIGHGGTPFGDARVVWSARGITALSFDDPDTSIIQAEWPAARWRTADDEAQLLLNRVFATYAGKDNYGPVSLWVRGSNFQLNVWRALLQLPAATLSTYGDLAASLGKPTAARAIGNAVGANPVAVLIPCHRVIQATGKLGGYRWGSARKQALLAQEWLATEGLTGC